jgi:hypothetical protein
MSADPRKDIQKVLLDVGVSVASGLIKEMFVNKSFPKATNKPINVQYLSTGSGYWGEDKFYYFQDIHFRWFFLHPN